MRNKRRCYYYCCSWWAQCFIQQWSDGCRHRRRYKTDFCSKWKTMEMNNMNKCVVFGPAGSSKWRRSLLVVASVHYTDCTRCLLWCELVSRYRMTTWRKTYHSQRAWNYAQKCRLIVPGVVAKRNAVIQQTCDSTEVEAMGKHTQYSCRATLDKFYKSFIQW